MSHLLLLGATEAMNRHGVERMRPRTGPGGQPIRTTPDGWARIIAEFVHEGRFDTINFVPVHEDVEQLTRFATEVIPAARAAIAEYQQRG